MPILRLGTRGSQLALVQAHLVKGLLRQHAGLDVEIVVIKTSGDRLTDARLSEIGGKGLFVKELEDALLDGTIDLAVHSSKDMPARLPAGLALAAALPREDPRDALVLPAAQPAADFEAAVRALGPAPRVGTSSVRRTAQLVRLLPAATFVPLRGNLDTRLRRLDAGDFGAIVLAAAGLRRLDLSARISTFVPPHVCVPAPGQGIIAIETRGDDDVVRRAAASIGDASAWDALEAERAVVARLGGGCQMPIGAHAAVSGDTMELIAVVIAPDGSREARATVRGARAGAAALGRQVAERLLAEGAGDILASLTKPGDAESSH